MSTTTKQIDVKVTAVWGVCDDPHNPHRRSEPVEIGMVTRMPEDFTGKDIGDLLERVWQTCNRGVPGVEYPTRMSAQMDVEHLPSMSVGDGVIVHVPEQDRRTGEMGIDKRFFTAESVGFDECQEGMFWDFMKLGFRERSMGTKFGFWVKYKELSEKDAA